MNNTYHHVPHTSLSTKVIIKRYTPMLSRFHKCSCLSGIKKGFRSEIANAFPSFPVRTVVIVPKIRFDSKLVNHLQGLKRYCKLIRHQASPQIYILIYFCLCRRYEEVENILATGDISVKEITSLGKELSSLGRLTELTDKRSEKVKSIEELREVEKEAEQAGVDGAEMLQMATEERIQSEEELLAIEDEIVSVVTPKDEIDERNVILEIRAGTGMFLHVT